MTITRIPLLAESETYALQNQPIIQLTDEEKEQY